MDNKTLIAHYALGICRECNWDLDAIDERLDCDPPTTLTQSQWNAIYNTAMKEARDYAYEGACESRQSRHEDHQSDE
jgi:hypothetical protein